MMCASTSVQMRQSNSLPHRHDTPPPGPRTPVPVGDVCHAAVAAPSRSHSAGRTSAQTAALPWLTGLAPAPSSAVQYT